MPPPLRSAPEDLDPWTVHEGKDAADPARFRFDPPPPLPTPGPAFQPPPAPVPVAPARPARPRPVEADPARTVGIGKDMVAAATRRLLLIQYYDGVSAWHDLEQVRPGGHVVGRGSFRADLPAGRFLAEAHARLDLEDDRLFVEEVETINGVYRNVPAGTPAELTAGTRFQVGQHVIAFVPAEPAREVEAAVSPEGETFRSRLLWPLAYLDFIGPDGRATVRVPLTKPEGTVIGREGRSSDVVLAGDEWASRGHARVSKRDSGFVLEDLGSTNGTFVRLSGRTPLRTARPNNPAGLDVLLIGAILVRVVEA